METVRIAITGHVDHGKSTLIGRLLYDTGSVPESVYEEVRKICEELGKEMDFAYLLDSLEEERERNVTIDVSHVFFQTRERDYVIIDAPGHLEFLKNMITGASQADAAVLIVDVAAGIEEQTRRHAFLLELLGIREVLVVVNKMDLVGYRREQFDAVQGEVAALLKRLGLPRGSFVPVSAAEGDNISARSVHMPWYEGPVLVEALDGLEFGAEDSQKPLRFPVQDVYTVGDKKILVGKMVAGTLRASDEVTFLPSGVTAKVRSLEVWGGQKELALAGESIGVTLEGDPPVGRGQVACAGRLPEPREHFQASIFWLVGEGGAPGETLVLKCATQETDCEIESVEAKFDAATLETVHGEAGFRPSEIGRVMIRTAAPVVVEAFQELDGLGRFVLLKGNDTVAGGIVTG